MLQDQLGSHHTEPWRATWRVWACSASGRRTPAPCNWRGLGGGDGASVDPHFELPPAAKRIASQRGKRHAAKLQPMVDALTCIWAGGPAQMLKATVEHKAHEAYAARQTPNADCPIHSTVAAACTGWPSQPLPIPATPPRLKHATTSNPQAQARWLGVRLSNKVNCLVIG